MKKIILAALATLTLVACGGSNPRVYLLASDPQATARGSLPTSCTNDEKSAYTDTYQNIRNGAEIEIWDGVDGKMFLDIGGTFGPNVQNALIEGDGKTFAGTFVETYQDPNTSGNTWTENTSFGFNFEELGATARGNATRSTNRTCAGVEGSNFCAIQNKESAACAFPATPFVGRQIHVSNEKSF